jgi:hypothetical protein
MSKPVNLKLVGYRVLREASKFRLLADHLHRSGYEDDAVLLRELSVRMAEVGQQMAIKAQ